MGEMSERGDTNIILTLNVLKQAPGSIVEMC